MSSEKFTVRLLGKQKAPVVIATLISARIWFEVDPQQGEDVWDISVKADEAEFMKRVVLIAGEI